jgi:tRNA(fMet)-specific endonuclease VapC
MKYLLDTNAVIVYLNGRSEKLKHRLLNANSEQIVLCSIVKAELFYGAMKSQNPIKTLSKIETLSAQFQSIAFDDYAAQFYGKIRADLNAKGTPIGHNDLLIAAIALSNQFVLITHNTREFNRVENLMIEDWEI